MKRMFRLPDNGTQTNVVLELQNLVRDVGIKPQQDVKRAYIVGAISVALLAAAVLYLYGGGQTPAGQPPLKNLSAQGVGEIKNEFNAAKHDVRVLLLLSPT